MQYIKTFSLIAFFILLSACSTTHVYNSVVQDYAVLMTEDVKISAEDLNWELTYGTPKMPPAYLRSHLQLVKDSNGRVIHRAGDQIQIEHITADYELFFKKSNSTLRSHAFPVRVSLDGSKNALYGVMLFSSAREDITESSARRMWTVSIPQRYINIAKSGQVAVVYQPAKTSTSKQDVATWVLWLSALPISFEHSKNPVAPAASMQSLFNLRTN